MRVAHLTASTMFGGPERQMLGLAEHLPRHWQTYFLSFPEGGRCQAFLQAVEARGFPGIRLATDSPRIRSTLRELTNHLASIQADALLCHGYKSNLLGRIAARRIGIPAIAVSRGWTGENRKVRFYESLDRRHLRWMDHVVAVSKGQAEKVRCCGVSPNRLSIIRNSARLDAFQNLDLVKLNYLRQMFPVQAEGRPIVMAAGRLSPEKGFSSLVEAATMLPEANFILFGDGVERTKLEQKILMHGLKHRFVLAGFTDQLDRLMPCADLFVLPSYTEGLPNVALEASAAGVAVVATNVGGTPEVVIDGLSGLLVPPGSPWHLAQAIGYLLEHDELRQQMGRAGRERVHVEFTFTAQADAYQSLLIRLTGRQAVHAN